MLMLCPHFFVLRLMKVSDYWEVFFSEGAGQQFEKESQDPEKIPSLLFMVKAFETPAYVSGFIALVLYLVKILCLIRCPDRKRLHLKAAYLTFSAIAGAAAGIGVIIFCVMLEKQKFTLGWAPALVGVGGFLHLSMACAGYLSWRNGPIDDDFFDEDDEAFLEKSPEIKKTNGPGRPNRPAPPPPPPPKPKPQIKPKPDALLLRSMSSPAPKTNEYNAV
ncbi:hypothetical protein LOTGIDRAFT_156186 [Lottia gigantea]|uniref:Uncharacterized protein n=1 Tax=Lottia gigantea TaxID=225164 RepID=V4B3K5_LOTGI|nr:hypothetical protein LOTGIDRAFT_156186 [Lottia gigantea]ESP04943.1 hypothetical protein LOTGIDRAFT_156186 [Lottia gigantea]